jgi:TRAP-type C4-dicarboxylate transport system permease small subunit
MEKAYFLWKTLQDKFIAPLTALVFLGPILLACVEVIRRYLFGASWDWQQDVVTYFILSATYLFFAITQRQGMHLKVTLFSSLLSKKVHPKAGNIMRLLAQLASVLYLGYVVFYGFKVTQTTYTTGRLVLSQSMVFWPFFLILTLGLGLMLISFLFDIFREVQAMRGKVTLVEETGSGHSTD